MNNNLFSHPINKILFRFIFILTAPCIAFANGSDTNVPLFHCDEPDWSKFAVYTQTHNEQVHICLLNEIENHGKKYLKTPYNCYFYIAQADYYRADHGNCTHYAQKALNATNKPRDSIMALLLLSRTYRANDDLSTAQSYTLQTLNIAQRSSLDEERAFAYIELARINYTLNDSLKATEYLDQAGNIIENTENQNLKGVYYYQKARVQHWYEGKTNLDEVVAQLLKSLEYFEATANHTEIATTLDFLGSCYWRKDEYGQAQSYYEKSLSIRKKLGNNYGQAISYNNLAGLSYKQSNIQQAIKYYKKSAELSKSIDAFELLQLSYANITVMYESEKILDSTMLYFRKEIAVMDTLKVRQRTELVYDLQTKYETREKEQQIKAQKQQLTYSGLTMGLLLLTVGLIYRLYRQKTQVNNFKNQLFSIIGHDLRGMTAQLHVAQRSIERTHKPLQDPKLAKSTSKMGAIIEGLTGFIENVLYWGATQTDRLFFDYQKLHVDRLVSIVAANFKYDLARKNIALKKDIPQDFHIYADKNTVQVVIRNLLSNALKFSEPNSEIFIQAIQNPNYTLVKIKDSGIGIPPDKIPQLFTTNKTVSTKGTKGEKGTGLGLWLCKEMMTKNKGKISVESTPNEGTCFILYFPNHIESNG